MAENKVVDIILHCQKQIKKERLPEEKLLHYLGRLSRLRVTVQDLAETGIGRTVNSLSRNEGSVGQAADTLVRGWKRMVSEQQNQAERESEEDSDSGQDSGSSDEDEDEEEVKNVDSADTYEIEEPEENQPQERRYNGHSSGYEDIRGSSEPPGASHHSRSYPDDVDIDDLNDDIDDPYMENGFLNMTNVHSDGDDDEDEIDDNDSDGSERLEIDADDDPDQTDQIDEKPPSFNIKQERHLDEREERSSHSSKSTGIHKPHENDRKKQDASGSSSSKSHRNHERSNEKSQSKEHKHHHRSSSKETSSKDKNRSKQSVAGNGVELSSSSSLVHKSHHQSSSTSSNTEKPKETKSDNDKSHHKDKDRHHRSKESSSHRDKEKSEKEKERSSKHKKDLSDHHRSGNSSSSSHKNKVRDPTSSSSSQSQSPKKSSLENSIKKEMPSSHDDRKRKEHSSNSPCDSSSNKKSKLVLKEEIDSNSGINFADVLGSLDVPPSGSSSTSKHSSLKKEKKKDDNERGHRKHDSHHSSSSSKKHDSPSKHSSSRDAGSSSSSSSKKYDKDSSSKMSKKAIIPPSKIESVIQPVVNISPNYKPMTPSLAKVARASAVSSSGNGNGIVTPLPLPLLQSDLSDLASVDYWDNAGKSDTHEMSQEDAISTMLSSRNARSKVFSGAKLARRPEVTSLYDLCMQVIKDNIGDLGYTGGIPYDILKPALERANPQQLMSIESQNDYLIGETDELWQFHSKRDFRGKVPAETESWRELYERCTEERQERFEVIKKKMKRTIEKAEPQRKAKLAYVDTSSSTRFNRQKAQTIKNGMKTLKIKEEKGPSRGVASSASAGFNNPKKSGDSTNVLVEEASVIIAPESRAGHAPAPSVSREVSAAKLKPKKAPLMQKTMKLIKSLSRR